MAAETIWTGGNCRQLSGGITFPPTEAYHQHSVERERESRYMQVLGRAYPAALVHVWSLVYSANTAVLVVLSSCRTLMANHHIDKYGRLITTGPSWPCMDTTMHMHNAIYSCQIPPARQQSPWRSPSLTSNVQFA